MTGNFKSIDLDGIQLAYMDTNEAEKPVLILVHGLECDHTVWRKVWPMLREKYRCIAPDLPGHGQSPAGNYSYTPSFFADIIRRLCSHLNLNQFQILAHSMGAQATTVFALNQPALISRLVLLTPAGLETFNTAEKNALISYTRMKHFASENSASPADFFRQVNPFQAGFGQKESITTACTRGMLEEPVIRYYSALSVPVLIILAEKDMLIPNRYLHPGMDIYDIAGIARELMPWARVAMVKNAGHFVQLDAPENLVSILEEE